MLRVLDDSLKRDNLLTVVILSVRGTLVRRFMLAAHELGMTRGDWAFLDVEIFHVRRHEK